ncbi:hypothetical protein FKO01_41090 [Mesorhizobium sp. B2-3-3]|nr:hypothetical protein FKO01_41090 [Mesorhizobium sp. B2-3-3]
MPRRAFRHFSSGSAIESLTRSNSLFLRSLGRKTATHFSWNCSSPAVHSQTPPGSRRDRACA